MARLVLDTDVVVAAMRCPNGASAALLRAVRGGDAELVLTAPLAFEYESVCKRREHREAAGLSAREVEVFVNGVIALSIPVISYFLWRPQLRDANDEIVLEAAVNGRAAYLVTFNLRDFGDVPAAFGVEALLPRDTLRRIR